MEEFKDLNDLVNAAEKWIENLFGSSGLFGQFEEKFAGAFGEDFSSAFSEDKESDDCKSKQEIKPKILWDELPLAQKDEVEEAVLWPIIKKGLAKEYGIRTSKGVLLFGPPGCGKTLLMKALAKRFSENNVKVYLIHLSDILSKWYGSSEQKLKALFAKATSSTPAYVFIDEFESIGKKRELYNADDVTPRLLSILLGILDGMSPADDFGIIASTNRVEFIDDALLRPGRFDKIIYVPPPDISLRREIFKIHSKGRKISEIDFQYLAEISSGYSGADIALCWEEASRVCMRKAVKTGQAEPITTEDVHQVLMKMNPSIHEQDLIKYEKMRERFQRMS